MREGAPAGLKALAPVLAVVLLLALQALPAGAWTYTAGPEGRSLRGSCEVVVPGGAIQASLDFGGGSYNSDLTFYPQDRVCVRLSGQDSPPYLGLERYQVEVSTAGGRVTVDGAELKGRSREVTLPVGGEHRYEVRGVRIRATPKPAEVEVIIQVPEEPTVAQLLEKMARVRAWLDGSPLSLSQSDLRVLKATIEVGSGQHTVKVGEVEGWVAPPPLPFYANPGELYRVGIQYGKENEREAGAGVSPSEGPELGGWGDWSSGENSLEILVVPYSPRFAVVGYEALARPSATRWGKDTWSYGKPRVCLVRYDGNNWDPDNWDRLTLRERAVVDSLSGSGALLKPVRAEEGEAQTKDNYDGRENLFRVEVLLSGESVPLMVVEAARSKGEFEQGKRVRVLYQEPSPWFPGGLYIEGVPSIYYLVFKPLENCPPPPPLYVLFPREGNPSLRVTYRENAPATVEALGGAKLDPGWWEDPSYRRWPDLELQYYQEGEIKTYDNGEPVYESDPLELGFLAYGRVGIYLGGSMCGQFDLRQEGEPVGVPMVFDGDRRYARFELSDLDWMLGGTGGLEGNRNSLTVQITGSYGSGTSLTLQGTWDPVGRFQPVEVTVWRLRERAVWGGEEVEVRKLIQPDNHPEAVMSENLWEVSEENLELSLLPLSLENVLDPQMLSLLEGLGVENLLGMENLSSLGEAWEIVPLLTDPHFYENYLQDTVEENEPGVRVVWSGGRVVRAEEVWGDRTEELEREGQVFVLRRHGSQLFLVEARAGENRSWRGWVTIPFNPEENYPLSFCPGGGFSVKVEEDLPWQTRMRVYTPPQAGDLVSLRIYRVENGRRGAEVYSWPEEWAADLFSQMGLSPMGFPGEVELRKAPGMENVEVELMNSMGAVQTFRLSLCPYASEVEYRGWRVFSVLLMAFLAALAWALAWRVLRGGKGF